MPGQACPVPCTLSVIGHWHKKFCQLICRSSCCDSTAPTEVLWRSTGQSHADHAFHAALETALQQAASATSPRPRALCRSSDSVVNGVGVAPRRHGAPPGVFLLGRRGTAPLQQVTTLGLRGSRQCAHCAVDVLRRATIWHDAVPQHRARARARDDAVAVTPAGCGRRFAGGEVPV